VHALNYDPIGLRVLWGRYSWMRPHHTDAPHSVVTALSKFKDGIVYSVHGWSDPGQR
jgi:hypothetical protein